ncbi:MAG: hypothetical protein IT532_04010 [Burkholderiales bacterium]|nr:hypothetical protein [Burkholderiales bacterium]
MNNIVAVTGFACLMLMAPGAKAHVVWSKCTEEVDGGTLHAFRFAIGKTEAIVKKNQERVTSEGDCETALSCRRGWYAQIVTHVDEDGERRVAEGVSCGARTQDEAIRLAQQGCYAAAGGPDNAPCRTVLHLGQDDNSVGDELPAGASEMTGGDYDRQGCLDQAGRMGHAVTRGQFFECF